MMNSITRRYTFMCKVLFVSVLKLDWFPGKHTVEFIQCKLMMNSISDFKQILADLFETFDSQSIKKHDD